MRYAGGVVRDALMGRLVSGDVDLATTATPQQTIDALESAGLRAVPTGFEHGTITAVLEGAGSSVEVTTLRHDVATDGRHAEVAFGADWREDALRRDFTINALFADADGTVHDFTGGIADATAGRVRFVGDAEKRVAEDYLRILRFFRFQAVLGRTEPEAETLAILARHAPALARLSAERVTRELLKLLGADDPAPTWALAAACSIDRVILGHSAGGAPLARLIACEKLAGLKPEPLRRLALLGLPDGDAPGLALSNAQQKALAAMQAAGETLSGANPPGEAQLRAWLYRLGRDVCRDGLMLAWARDEGWDAGRAANAVAQAQQLAEPVFPLNGRDVLALGAAPGPGIGEILRTVEEWWAEGGFSAGREECLARLRAAHALYSTRTV